MLDEYLCPAFERPIARYLDSSVSKVLPKPPSFNLTARNLLGLFSNLHLRMLLSLEGAEANCEQSIENCN